MKKKIPALLCALACVFSSVDFSVLKTEAVSQVNIYTLPNSKIINKALTKEDDEDLQFLSISNPLSFSAASNERESSQLIIQSSANLSNIEIITADMISDKNGKITKDNISVSFEHYLYLDPNKKGYWALSKKDGYYPDPLIPYNVAKAAGTNKLDTSNGKNQGIWFTLNIPEGTDPGTYSSNFTLKYKINNTVQSVTVPVKVNVFDFELPDETSGKSYFKDYRGVSKDRDKPVYKDMAGFDNINDYSYAVSDFLDDRKLSNGNTGATFWYVKNLDKDLDKLYNYVTDPMKKAPYYNLKTNWTKQTGDIRFSRYDYWNSDEKNAVLGMEHIMKGIVDKSIEKETDLLQYAYLYCPQTDEPGGNDPDANEKVLVNAKIFEDTKKAVYNYIEEKCGNSVIGKRLKSSLEDVIYLPTIAPASKNSSTLSKTMDSKPTNAYYTMLYDGLDAGKVITETFKDVYPDGYTEGALKKTYTVTVDSSFKVKSYCPLFNDFTENKINDFYPKDLNTTLNAANSSEYKMWWYSCMSHATASLAGYLITGNDGEIEKGKTFKGNSLSIARANKWQQYKLGISGELYWAVDEYDSIEESEDNGFCTTYDCFATTNPKQIENDGILIYPNYYYLTQRNVSSSNALALCNDPANTYFSSSVRLENLSEASDDYDYLVYAEELINELKYGGVNTNSYKNEIDRICSTLFDDCDYSDGKATSSNLNTARNDLAELIVEMKHIAEGTENMISADYTDRISFTPVSSWKTSNKAVSFKYKLNDKNYSRKNPYISVKLLADDGTEVSAAVPISFENTSSQNGMVTECEDGWKEYTLILNDLSPVSGSKGKETASGLVLSNPNFFEVKDITVSDVVDASNNKTVSLKLPSAVSDWSKGGAVVTFKMKALSKVSSSQSVSAYFTHQSPSKRTTNYCSINYYTGSSQYGKAVKLSDGWIKATLPLSEFSQGESGGISVSCDNLVFKSGGVKFAVSELEVTNEITGSSYKGKQTFQSSEGFFEPLANWHESGKVLSFDYYMTRTQTSSKNTAVLSLMQINGAWTRLNSYITIDLNAKTVKCDSKICGTVTDKKDGWYNISIPLDSIGINTKEGANANMTLNALHFKADSVYKSFAIDNISIVNGISNGKNQTIECKDIHTENWKNSGKKMSFEFLPAAGDSNNITFKFSLCESDWHRVIDPVSITVTSGSGKANYGTVTRLSDGWYRYTADLSAIGLNTSRLEKSNGSETVDILYIDKPSQIFEMRELKVRY